MNQRLRLRNRERIAEVSRRNDRAEVPAVVAVAKPWRRRKLVLGLLLVPVCLIASLTFIELIYQATLRGDLWHVDGFWFFFAGCFFWVCLGWMGLRPRLLYVFAHEFTHLITARLSGGRIHDWHVSDEGGYVETDKTSTLITLSPYLVPLYTLLVFALYAVAGAFTNLHQEYQWHIFSLVIGFKWAWVFYFLAGVTWFFHLTFTIEVLRTEQSDLLHNGEFFSMMVIFLGNLAILGALFVSASPGAKWSKILDDSLNLVLTVWHWVF